MSTGRSGWGDPPDATALELVGAAAEACPNAPFLDFEGEVATYGAFATLVSSYATGIASSVRSGDRVVAMLDNSLEAVALWMATNVAGAIYIPLNTSLKGAWLDKQVELSEPSLIVCEDDYAGHFAAYIGQSDSRRFVTRLGETFEADGTVVTPEAIAGLRGSAPPTSLFAAPPVDISAVTFTSGTTAASKGCMLSPQYICNMARHILTFTERQPDEVCWTSLPLFHLNAMSSVVATAMLRGTLSVSKRFSLSGFWPAIERSNAKVVQMLGSMPWLVANASDEEAARRCYGQVRVVVGAPINAEVGARLRERFGVRQIASQVYGSTEASCLTYFPCSETAPNGSSGRRHDDFDVRIFDEADREVPSGEVGEIV